MREYLLSLVKPDDDDKDNPRYAIEPPIEYIATPPDSVKMEFSTLTFLHGFFRAYAEVEPYE